MHITVCELFSLNNRLFFEIIYIPNKVMKQATTIQYDSSTTLWEKVKLLDDFKYTAMSLPYLPLPMQ